MAGGVPPAGGRPLGAAFGALDAVGIAVGLSPGRFAPLGGLRVTPFFFMQAVQAALGSFVAAPAAPAGPEPMSATAARTPVETARTGMANRVFVMLPGYRAEPAERPTAGCRSPVSSRESTTAQ